MTDFKQTIIAELDVLRRISATEKAGTFKARVYVEAIKTLSALPYVRTMEDVPAGAFGKQVQIKIGKIIANGGLEISEAARATANALGVFQDIYGVGPKKAQDLVAAGHTTIEGLRLAITKDPKLLNKNQRVGLQYYEQLLTRIPRAEMDQHSALLLAAKPATLEGIIVGSYRRGLPTSGDIDMLLTGSALDAFVAILKQKGYIKEILAHGEHKCMAICQLPGSEVVRHLDLIVTPANAFPFTLFYFTGCDTFNVAVRSHALRMGFTLNEHALTVVASGKVIGGIKREEDIFAVLKLRWVPPTERTGPEMVIPL